MEKPRLVISGSEAREKILAGVKKVAEVVGSTLGPYGRNVLIDRGYRFPRITNDGVTVAKEIILEDEAEQMGAMALVEAAKRTNQDAGDGTSTSVVLAASITEKGLHKLGESAFEVGGERSVMKLKHEIDEAKKLVLAEITKHAKPALKEDLELVAIASVENEELGKHIAEIVDKVGIDGCVIVEESLGDKMEFEVVEGMKKMGTYAHPGFATNERGEIVAEDVPVLVIAGNVFSANKVVDDFNAVKHLADDMLKNGFTKLVIFAEKYSTDVIQYALANKLKGVFNFYLLKTPALMPEEIEDIAIYTGTKILDQNIKNAWQNYNFRDLGKVRKLVVTKDDINLYEGDGAETEIAARVASLKLKLEKEEIEPVKERIKRQLGAMAEGQAIIRVGSKAYTEASYLKDKIEDAVHAVKCAMEEGVVKGGGLCLKEIAESLPENILTDSLKTPYYKIQDNAGEAFEVSDSILDPAKVVRCSIENACAVAGTLLTTNTIIAQQSEDNHPKFLKLLKEIWEAVKAKYI